METDDCSDGRYNSGMVKKPKKAAGPQPAKPINQWVRDALAHADMAQAEMARLLTERLRRSYDRSIVNKMTIGREVSADEASIIADITGLPVPGYTAAELNKILREIKVVGYVGAGEQVLAFDESMGEQETIEEPPNVGPNAVAVRVRGDSMFPELDPDDVLVYDTRYESNFDNFVGRRLIISLQDGRQFVKRLKKGSAKDLYTLVSSNPRERDIEDVTIEWVAPIAWIKPRW